MIVHSTSQRIIILPVFGGKYRYSHILCSRFCHEGKLIQVMANNISVLTCEQNLRYSIRAFFQCTEMGRATETLSLATGHLEMIADLYCRITEYFEQEGILKMIQPHCCGQGHIPLNQLDQSPNQPGLEHFQG